MLLPGGPIRVDREEEHARLAKDQGVVGVVMPAPPRVKSTYHGSVPVNQASPPEPDRDPILRVPDLVPPDRSDVARKTIRARAVPEAGTDPDSILQISLHPRPRQAMADTMLPGGRIEREQP